MRTCVQLYVTQKPGKARPPYLIKASERFIHTSHLIFGSRVIILAHDRGYSVSSVFVDIRQRGFDRQELIL